MFHKLYIFVLSFSLLQNLYKLFKNEYLFSIIYLISISILYLLKYFYKYLNITNNIIIYLSLIIANLYIFIPINIKENLVEKCDDDLRKDAKEICDSIDNVGNDALENENNSEKENDSEKENYENKKKNEPKITKHNADSIMEDTNFGVEQISNQLNP